MMAPEYVPGARLEPFALTVTVEPETVALSQDDPFSIEAAAPIVAPDGNPETVMVCDDGIEPPTGWLKSKLVGVTETFADAINNVTGIVCAGMFGDELVMLMLPVY